MELWRPTIQLTNFSDPMGLWRNIFYEEQQERGNKQRHLQGWMNGDDSILKGEKRGKNQDLEPFQSLIYLLCVRKETINTKYESETIKHENPIVTLMTNKDFKLRTVKYTLEKVSFYKSIIL